jgi:hypothetical protein
MEDKAKIHFWKHAFTYGVIMAAVSIFLSLAFYFTNLYLKSWSQYANMGVGIVVLVYLMIQYRKEVRGGFASFGQVFSMSFVSGLVSIIIGILFGILMMNVLFPDMKEAMTHMVEERILNNPRIPESMVDQAVERASKNFEPVRQLLFGIGFGAFFQAIISLIVAAIIKKEEPIAQV